MTVWKVVKISVLHEITPFLRSCHIYICIVAALLPCLPTPLCLCIVVNAHWRIENGVGLSYHFMSMFYSVDVMYLLPWISQAEKENADPLPLEQKSKIDEKGWWEWTPSVVLWTALALIIWMFSLVNICGSHLLVPQYT